MSPQLKIHQVCLHIQNCHWKVNHIKGCRECGGKDQRLIMKMLSTYNFLYVFLNQYHITRFKKKFSMLKPNSIALFSRARINVQFDFSDMVLMSDGANFFVLKDMSTLLLAPNCFGGFDSLEKTTRRKRSCTNSKYIKNSKNMMRECFSTTL